MPIGDIPRLISDRLALVDCEASSVQLGLHAGYLQHLARWNKRLNLTSLDVDAPSHEAIDRLIVEPVKASTCLAPSDVCVVDIGSGAGSPAIPLAISAPDITVVMVESRSRKVAFLRESVRFLGLPHVSVTHSRIEDLVKGSLRWNRSVDVVTMRAVRLDHAMVTSVDMLLSPNGRFFLFHSEGHVEQALSSNENFECMGVVPLLHSNASRLSVFSRSSAR
jgi:16S rRNA (guanine527-N7)-methyltransferase